MDLLEYQGKQLFARHGMPGPRRPPAQHGRRGRRRRGGDRLPVRRSRPRCRSAAAARPAASRSPTTARRRGRTRTRSSAWTSGASRSTRSGSRAPREIDAEYYASIIFDRGAKAPLMMLSTKGGMDIEAVAERDPGGDRAPARRPAAGLPGLPRPPARLRGGRRRRPRAPGRRAARQALRHVRRRGGDARRGQSADRHARARGRRRSTRRSRSTTTRSSATRTTPTLRDPRAEDPQEQMAKERGLTYVKLDGDIGILGNGAGLVMSTLDVVAQYGGAPANFLDAGGGSKAEAITSAVEVILSDRRSRPCCSTSSAASRAATRSRNGLIEAFDQIKPDGAVRRPPGRHQRRGGPARSSPRPHLPNVHTAATMDEAAAEGRRAGEGRRADGRPDRQRHQAVVSGITGREGTFHALNNSATARTSSRASRPARPARTSRASRCSTPSTTPSPRPAPTPR